MSKATEELFKLQDVKYGDFHAKLMPEIDRNKIIGVRTPDLRKLAKRIVNESYIEDFLEELPHKYYEENNLHGELIKLKYKDYDEFIAKLEAFLPYVDNWATCDMLSPKLFKKNTDKVYEKIKSWIKSGHAYTRRFAIVTLLGYFLDEAFDEEQLQLVANSNNDEYYIKMAVAWYFSFAIIKQYEVAVKYFEDKQLDDWTHNKAIQKCIESYRISDETKSYLKTLRVKSTYNISNT